MTRTKKRYDWKCKVHGVFEEKAVPGRSYVRCYICGLPSEKVWLRAPSTLNTLGRNFDNLRVVLGRSFSSAKEVDEHCEREGLSQVTRTMYCPKPVKPDRSIKEHEVERVLSEINHLGTV